MERSEWDDDEQYPAAPVPPHERAWRHPSELGEIARVRAEPPLALGRGLMIATGAIGSLLAVAVLWAMLPASSDTPAAGSVTVERVATLDVSRGRTTTTWRAAGITLPADLSSIVSTIASTISRATTTSGPVTPAATDEPMPTVQLVPADPATEGSSAVALAGSTLLLTTAKAVGDDTTVQVTTGDGALAATVVMRDSISGVAVLEAEVAGELKEFVLASCAPGEHVHVLSDEPFEADVVEGDGGRLALDADRTAREGTPVVNGQGHLVGLYSHSDAGSELVRVDGLSIGSTSTTSSTSSTGPVSTAAGTDPGSTPTTARPLPVWMGVQVDDSGDVLVVTAVATDGPAARAGLAAGDVITAVDGTAVADRADVADALSGHAPGDTVAVTYTRDATSTVVAVVLDARPAL